jgi:hypothetical protein
LTQFGDANSLSSLAVSAHEPLVRWIDTLMEYLYLLRQQLSSKDAEKLLQELSRARLGREKWMNERSIANWAAAESAPNVALPTAKEVFSRMFTFGGGRKPKPPK